MPRRDKPKRDIRFPSKRPRPQTWARSGRAICRHTGFERTLSEGGNPSEVTLLNQIRV
jgi:hypothetical protein